MQKIIHIITGLNDGGAEGTLYRLCINDKMHKHIVISLMDEGKYGPLLKKENIEVFCLNMPQGKLTFSGIKKLFKILKEQKPDIVQTWMYHSDFIGGIVAKFAGVQNIFWGVRNSTLEKGKSKFSTRAIAKLCALISGLVPKKIIYCAYKAKEVHELLGYKKQKAKIIGNGYDFSKFSPNINLRKSLRANLKLDEKENLLGMVARFDPYKDHLNLFNALKIVKEKGFSFKLLLVGYGMDKNNKELLNHIKNCKLVENIILLGQRYDIPAIMNGIDMHILSSMAEAFPNVLAEAMACETPCVATDVGDTRLIVGDTGWIVPPKDSISLAKAIIGALKEKSLEPKKWENRKKACRKYIVDNFGIEKMITSYHKVWFGEL